MRHLIKLLSLTIVTLLMSNMSFANEDLAAVISPTGICTMDYNQCGQASICSCPEGYEYDSKVGYCLIKNVRQAAYAGVDHRGVASSCSIQVPAGRACTRDINPAGYASSCDCSGIGDYDARLGQCVLN
jgi:hypothetical protein